MALFPKLTKTLQSDGAQNAADTLKAWANAGTAAPVAVAEPEAALPAWVLPAAGLVLLAFLAIKK